MKACPPQATAAAAVRPALREIPPRKNKSHIN